MQKNQGEVRSAGSWQIPECVYRPIAHGRGERFTGGVFLGAIGRTTIGCTPTPWKRCTSRDELRSRESENHPGLGSIPTKCVVPLDLIRRNPPPDDLTRTNARVIGILIHQTPWQPLGRALPVYHQRTQFGWEAFALPFYTTD